MGTTTTNPLDFTDVIYFVQEYGEGDVQIDRLTLEDDEVDGDCETECGVWLEAPYWTCDVAVFEGGRVRNRCYRWGDITRTIATFTNIEDARALLAALLA